MEQLAALAETVASGEGDTDAILQILEDIATGSFYHEQLDDLGDGSKQS